MKSFGLIIVAFLILGIFSGCYATITGTVIDAETGEPIEGAVVFVEWTVTKGLGLTYHEVYKIIEVATDKNGRFTISGTYNPLVDPPDILIYKAGYAAWNNKFIFPNYEKRTDFKWHKGYVFKLELFKDTYSFIEHQAFIEGNAPHATKAENQLLLKAYEEWEREKVIKERQRKGVK